MARTGSNPLYQRGSLASGAVGVPMVADPSKEIYAAGEDLLKIGEAYLKVEAEKRKLSEDIAAEKYKIQWEHEYFKELENQKQQSQEDPYGLADKTFSMGEESISSFAKNIKNPRVRDAFNKKTTASLGSAQKMMRDWASNQTVTNAYRDVEDSLATLYQQAGNMNSPEQFGMLRNQAESLIYSATPIIGTKGAEKMKKEMGKQMGENFIYAKIDDNPAAVKGFINSGMFDDIFDEKEKYAISHTADLIVKRNQKEQEEAATAKAGRDFQGLLDKAVAGELTLYEINTMIEDEKRIGGKGKAQRLANLQTLRQAAVESTRYPNARISKEEALVAVNDIFSPVKETTQRKSKDGKTTKTGEVDYSLTGATFEQLQQMQDTLDANALFLSPEFRRKKYQTMNQLWDDYLEGNKYHKKTDRKSPYDIYQFNDGLSAINQYIDKRVPPEERNMLKAQFAEEYSATYDKYSQQPNFSFDKLMRYWTSQIDKNVRVQSRY